jgi:hypothetical protein
MLGGSILKWEPHTNKKKKKKVEKKENKKKVCFCVMGFSSYVCA